MSPHRRRQIQRRRIVALSVFAVGVLVISLAIDAGGGGSSHHTTGASLQPPPIVSLEATVQEDLRRQAAAQNVGIDHVLKYTPFVTSGGGRRKEIALTFDDGPGPYTPQIVNSLKKAHVPATFFEVGFLETYFHAGTRDAARAFSPPGGSVRVTCRRLRSATRSIPRRSGYTSSAFPSRACSARRTARSTTPPWRCSRSGAC